jgi:hypothetical protein
MQHNQKHVNDFAHQISFDLMLEIALVGFNFEYILQLPLLLPIIYDLTTYVVTYITHFQQVFDYSFQLHHSTLASMEFLFNSQCHSPCRNMY